MEIKLNLANRPYLNRQNVRLWLLFAAAMMILMLLFNGSHAYQNYRQLQLLDSRSDELEAQVSGISGAPAGYSKAAFASLKASTAQANEIVTADQFRWTRLLDRFEELVPVGVKVLSIQPNFTKKSVQLSCRAKDVSSMTDFVDNLLVSEDMNQAFLKSHGEVVSQKDGIRQSQVSFSLMIEEAF